MSASSSRQSIEQQVEARRRARIDRKRQEAMQAKSKKDAFREQLEKNSAKLTGTPAALSQPPQKRTPMDNLLLWCKKMTRDYKGVDVTNFTSSWADGLAFCALLHNFLPDKIPFDTLTPEDRRHNFVTAFDAAREAGVPDLLDADDLVKCHAPEPKSVATYVSGVYQTFCAPKK